MYCNNNAFGHFVNGNKKSLCESSKRLEKPRLWGSDALNGVTQVVDVKSCQLGEVFVYISVTRFRAVRSIVG